jgi:hypothetical protein
MVGSDGKAMRARNVVVDLSAEIVRGVEGGDIVLCL